jgi:hypothetical protein
MKQLLIDAAYVMEKWWAKLPKEMSMSDREVLARVQAAIDAPVIDIASAIHYPECWDTAAYPHLKDALHEMTAWFKCSNDDCAKPQQPVADLTNFDIDAVRDDESCPSSVICLSVADVLWIGRAVLAAQKAKAGPNGATPQ